MKTESHIYTESIKELKIFFFYVSPQFGKTLLVPPWWGISVIFNLSYKEDLKSQCKEDMVALFPEALSSGSSTLRTNANYCAVLMLISVSAN